MEPLLMANRCQPAKRQAWRERLERCNRSQMTVADFCADEGVLVALLYQWRRKLEPDSPMNTSEA
jgi:transposase-like protein